MKRFWERLTTVFMLGNPILGFCMVASIVSGYWYLAPVFGVAVFYNVKFYFFINDEKNINIEKELRALEAKGVFINLDYDHYKDGTNCNWSIEFRDLKQTNSQTGWYGDNNEFGDTVDCIKAAIKFANWLLEKDHLYWYFYNVKETVTTEGHAAWMKHNEFMTLADEIVFGKKKDEI